MKRKAEFTTSFGRKNLLLAVVALVLVLMMAVGATYSWIEDIKLVQVQMTADGDSKPLTVGEDICATAEITKDETAINLGNIIKERAKNDADGTPVKDADGKDVMEKYIDKKGYFYESGDMHLSPCYSNGEDFYFAVDKKQMNGQDTSNAYRLGNKDDENVNYISMTLEVSSPVASADFWFDEIPTVKASNGSEIEGARYSVTVDGVTKVFSKNGTDCKTVASTTATTTQTVLANRLARFTYGNSENTTTDLGKNGNILFSVNKGESVTLNVKIWLQQGTVSDVDLSNIDLTIVSSLNKTHRILFQDNTTGAGAESWLGNESARMFLAVPSLRIGSSWQQGKSYWEMKKNNSLSSSAGKDVYCPVDTSGKEISLPATLNGEKVYFLRCSSNGWNTGDSLDILKNIGISNFYNYWDANIPNVYDDSKFTVYGGTLDQNAVDRIGDGRKPTFRGNGTWGEVVTIKVTNDNTSTNLAPEKKTNGDLNNLFIVDHSDEDTLGEIHYQTMNCFSQSGNNHQWRAYVPASSTKLEFWFHQYRYNDNENNTQRYWAYREDRDFQVRPKASTVYHLTSETAGYWEGSGKIYFVNTGKWSLPRAYLWQEGKDPYKAWAGESMKKTDMTVKVNNVSYDVYSYEINSDNLKFNNIIFNNGSSGDGGNNGVGSASQTRNLIVQVGKFYYYNYSNNKDNGKWYDSLSDIPDSDVSGGGGDDGGGGSVDYGDHKTISDYYLYAYIQNDSAHTHVTPDKAGDLKFRKNSGNSYRLLINLTKDVPCYIHIRKLNGTNVVNEFGVGGSGTKIVRASTNPIGFYSTQSSQPVLIETDVTGIYAINFTLDGEGHPQVTVTYPPK